ncbi:MAG TPA: hypothetical protein VKB86_16080, partial [Pyrinomonadaceae bacterium]|nr:hypothetical protein [Pyrinomonadaceae bacterium]
VVSAAKCLFGLGKEEDSYQLILNEIVNVNSNPALSILFKNLAALYGKAKEIELEALAFEKAVEYSPNDTHTLFDAALSMSKLGMSGLALVHYRTILDFKPEHSSALNNIGVEYDTLGLPIYSVSSYKKSSELNETLASANLAYRLINAGFAEEANDLLSKAKQLPDVHANVGSAISTLSQNREAEREKREKILNTSVKQQQFLRQYAQDRFSPKVEQNFAGAWLFMSGTEATLVQDGTQIELDWNIGGKKYQLTGTVINNSAKVTYFKMKYGFFTPANEIGFEKESEGYAFVSEDGQKLNIMLLKDNEPTFMELVRRASESEPENAIEVDDGEARPHTGTGEAQLPHAGHYGAL